MKIYEEDVMSETTVQLKYSNTEVIVKAFGSDEVEGIQTAVSMLLSRLYRYGEDIAADAIPETIKNYVILSKEDWVDEINK